MDFHNMIDSAIVNSFTPISLDEMEKVKLMNRIDTKFVTDIGRLVELLKEASPHYMIQQIGGRSNMPYYTKYFDTSDTEMFYQHQRGKKNRQKIRIRHYEECDTLPFVEVKTKNNKGRTRKKRVAMDKGEELSGYTGFLSRHTPFSISALVPHIENHFYRITLVNREMTERITIDTNLEFHNLITGSKVQLPNIGIIEWKRDGRTRNSHFETILKNLRIHPSGFSKYCIGMAVTNPALRQNRLKQKLRMIKKLM